MADFYDISLDFTLDVKGDIKVVEDSDAIKQSMNNIINTVYASRVGYGPANERYGLGLNRYLFQNMSQYVAQKLSENVYRQLTVYEPRIKLTNVHVTADLDEKTYDIKIIYSYKEVVRQETFKIMVRQL
jgi:phage baseplate assembly protein W